MAAAPERLLSSRLHNIGNPSVTYTYPKTRWWWEALIDWMVANPGKSLKEASSSHGGPIDVTYQTILNVTTSDLFKARLHARKQEVSLGVDLAIIGRTTKIAVLGLDAIQNVLEKKRDQIPLEELQAVTSSALDRLGYGPKPPAGGAVAAVNLTVNQQLNVDPASVAEARNLLRQREAALAALPPPRSESILNIENPEGDDDLPPGEGEIVDVEALDVS